MLKWTVRIVAGLAALALVTSAVAWVRFSEWRADAIALRGNDPDRKVAQTALGPVEYATFGEGLPVLAIHGTPGGYDQSVAVPRAVPERANRNVMTIAASRPGYLGTPLESGRSFEQQADLLAALIDELAIEKVVVFGASGGGPVALQFALRHSERTLGLVLYAPVVGTAPRGTADPRGLPPLPGWRMTMIEMGMWLVSGPAAGMVVHEFDSGDPVQQQSWQAMLRTAMPWAEHVEGQRNDVIQWLDPALDEWPVERIAVPTLIMHGDADRNASYRDSLELAARIPGAEMVTFRGGDHFVMVSRWAEVGGHMQSFFARFAGRGE